jgi:hypothetical protein
MTSPICPYCNEDPCGCPVFDIPDETAPDDPVDVDADEPDDGGADL